MTYYVYILSNERHTVFYTGVTNDLQRRVHEHKTRFYRGFTQRYNVNKLLYYEEYSSPWEAIAREKELKKFRRDFKMQLIRRENLEMKDLSEGWGKG